MRTGIAVAAVTDALGVPQAGDAGMTEAEKWTTPKVPTRVFEEITAIEGTTSPTARSCGRQADATTSTPEGG